MRVLIVDDEAQLGETLARGLRRRGMTVDLAVDGITGLRKALETPYDVVVLDRDLPGLHGDEVCRRLIAGQPLTRIIMLTAAASTDDLVSGFQVGSDDYLAKPFAFAELVARLTALGRRRIAATPDVIRVADVELDTARFEIRRGGSAIRLTPREFAVLHSLMRTPGHVLSAERLFDMAWDDQSDPFTSSVRVIVSRLRSKLGSPPLIETLVGRGYRIVDNPGSGE